MIQLVPIYPGSEHFEITLKACLPWLEKACEHNGEWTYEQVVDAVVNRKQMLWVIANIESGIIHGAGTTRIVILPNGEKIGRDVVFAGEEMGRFMHLLPNLEEYFKHEGCRSVKIHGRKGWAKKLTDYKIVGITFEKVL